MQITTSSGTQIRGDLIKSAVLRSDMSPVPSTFEGVIRVDEQLKAQFAEGKTITVNGDNYRIVKPSGNSGHQSQGQHDTNALQVTAILDACANVAFVRAKAIIKENCLLTEIYRAAGATIAPVAGDFRADRFNCMVGEVPSFRIARLLQEEGGIVRWKNGKLAFFRIPDLFQQKPAMSLPENSEETVQSSFKERHEISSFYSIASDGSFVYGNKTKARTAKYAPGKNQLQLYNMSRCLVLRKKSKINYNDMLFAGDIIDYQGIQPLVIVTAAHVFQSGTDGSGSNQYTKLWCSAVGAG